MKTENKTTSLVVQAARFGDLVQTGGLIASLSGKIYLCVDNALKNLAELLYPKTSIITLSFHGCPEFSAFSDIREKFEEMTKLTPNYIYNCNFSRISAALCRLFPEKHVIAYRASKHADGAMFRSEWMRLLFRFVMKRNLASINLVDAWRHLAPSPVDGASINPVAKAGGKGIGIVMSGRENRRSLPPQLLATIAMICLKVLKCQKITLFGLASDKPAVKMFMRNLPAAVYGNVQDLTGKTDWKNLSEKLAGLDLLVSPDTGTMHLAARIGVPVMGFFLSSALAHETGPYGSGHMIWQAKTACSPCLESASCDYNQKCLQSFQSREFLRALTQALGGEKVDCPEGLQLWRTGFDRLGQKLVLVAGVDSFSESREAARSLVCTHLNIQPERAFSSFDPQILESIASEFFPDTEWMLPPRRYC